MGIESTYVWLDGSLVPFEKATVHFLTPALHYGIAVFEGIRCYQTPKGPSVFRLRDHVERLLTSAKILGFRELPYTTQDLVDAVKLTVSANGFTECYVRPLIHPVGGCWNLTLDGGRPSCGIAVWKWNDYLGAESRAQGIRANIASFTRHHPNVTMTKAKITGNYVNSVLAKTESTRLGFDEAIMLDADGYVAECTGENLFLVKRGRILTTRAAPVLEGITRDSMIRLARDRGWEVEEATISRDQLYGADEVFVCGTAAECIGLREIDFRVIGSGTTGPVTRALQEAFHSLVHGGYPRFPEWLEEVTPISMARAHVNGG
jgi:branched-chain amino acid aminotransferase